MHADLDFNFCTNFHDFWRILNDFVSIVSSKKPEKSRMKTITYAGKDFHKYLNRFDHLVSFSWLPISLILTNLLTWLGRVWKSVTPLIVIVKINGLWWEKWWQDSFCSFYYYRMIIFGTVVVQFFRITITRTVQNLIF